MDPPRTIPSAPGFRFPAVDERLVAPEAHAEILDGLVYRTVGTSPEHATRHAHAAYVFSTRHDWTRLDADAQIVDRCFRVPVPIGALFDRELADDTAARALIAAGNPVLTRAIAAREASAEAQAFARSEARGRAEGATDALASAVLRMLSHRGVSIDEPTRTRITACHDLATLRTWLDRAMTAAHAGDLFAGDP